MAVNILVIIPEGQFSELLAEALAAGVILPSRAVAVTPPVTNGADNAGHELIVCDDAAPFTHGDVMCGIKGECRQVPEGSCQPLPVL